MILVLNCGSQSIKWKVFDQRLKLISSGQGFNLEQELNRTDETKVDLIGHRVVHGGGIFVKPTKITSENILELEKLNYLAPLHNPFNVLGIKECQKIFKNVDNIAVFDTEFFANLPEKAYTYALPEDIIKTFGFRRYGFHGISHEYVASKVKAKKIITVHLGGGASICAIKDGKAVDTSMGFTPIEGLVMMTRSGNIDAGIVLDLVKKFGLDRTGEILNKESGLKGICGEEDMLKILDKVKIKNKKAKLAFDIFIYSIQKYIGAYFAILGGCDALIFTGSIGAGETITRKSICKDLKFLSKTKVLTIPTDEELAIAQKVLNVK